MSDPIERLRAGWQVTVSNRRGLPRSPREFLRSLELLSSMRDRGWQLSNQLRWPQAADGTSIPWMSYPAIAFLDTLLDPTLRLFEYGSGGSTSWFADRVGSVTAVEHDQEWLAKVQVPANAQLVHVDCDGDWYHDSGTEYVDSAAAGAPWDVIVIDGAARVDCAEHVSRFLAPGGIVVLDDTHNPRLEPAQAALRAQGFGQIDFEGYRPAHGELGMTSIFSKDFNRLLVKDETETIAAP